MANTTHEIFQVCKICKQEKPRGQFYRHAGRKSGIATECKICDKKRAKDWVAKNRARQRKIANAWKNRNKDKISSSAKRRRAQRLAEDPKLREKQAAAARRNRAANPIAYRLHGHNASAKRREWKSQSGGTGFTKTDVEKKLLYQKNKCWWCSKRLKKYHIDHLIPLSRGGPHDASNIVLTCPPCNLQKSARMPSEFAGRLL
jgi:5-methylcytosine-specific restriction endonuclease McrA